MIGATEYIKLFKTGQYGKLYLVCGPKSICGPFEIYVLPENEKAIEDGPNSPPLNDDAIKVYGIRCEDPSAIPVCGWLYYGKWEQDFASLVEKRRLEIAAPRDLREEIKKAEALKESQRIADLLAKY